MAAYKNLRWKTLTILAVIVLFAAVGVYPILAQRFGLPAPSWLMAKQLQLGLDLKGGVHLVLRVNRDDALRISTEGVGEQLREALSAAGITVGAINVTSPTDLPRRGRARRTRTPSSGASPKSRPTSITSGRPASGGAYEFAMRPNIARGLREQTMVQAHDTIDRRVNELGVAEPNIASTATTATSCWCSCRASATSRAPRTSFSPPRSSSSSSSKAGPRRRARRCSRRTTARCRPTWKS